MNRKGDKSLIVGLDIGTSKVVALVGEYSPGNPIEVIGIGIEDKVEAAREFARAYAMDYPVLIAKEQGIPLMQALGNSKGGLPFTLFIDRNGVVIEKKLGLLRPSDLDEMVSQLKK